MKVVTLKAFPFAPENTVVNIGSYSQIGNNVQFRAGKFKYSLSLGKDIRPFAAATDSSLPVALLSKPIGDYTSDLGSYSLMAWLFYKGFKQGKGVGYYVGYGILGWMGGGILGRMVGNLFAKNYSGAGANQSDVSKADSKPSSSSASTSLDDSLITTASNNISIIQKQKGNNISGNEVKTKILNFSKNYTTIEKDVLAAFLGLFKKLPAPKKDSKPSDAFQFLSEMATAFEPLSKRYSEEEVGKAAEKITKDFESSSILPN